MKSTTKIIASSIAVSVAMAASFIKPEEGNIGTYLDVGGVPTDCYGNTLHVDMHVQRSQKECEDILTLDLTKRLTKIYAVLNPKPSNETAVAFASLAYNCGIGVFNAGNYIPKAWNERRFLDACLHIRKICTTANGKFMMGLQKRRLRESEMCIKGLTS